MYIFLTEAGFACVCMTSCKYMYLKAIIFLSCRFFVAEKDHTSMKDFLSSISLQFKVLLGPGI